LAAAARPRRNLPASAGQLLADAGHIGIGTMGLLNQIKLVWLQYRAFHAAFTELRGLSDRELSHLGLARDGIVRAAFEEAERRAASASSQGLGRRARAAGSDTALQPG
jgi:hypothetical protein